MSLVAWYPLNGDLLDHSGNGYNLTNNGAVLDNDGKIGSCYNFNGGYVYGTMPIKNYNNFTISFWCKLTNKNANQCFFSCRTGFGEGISLFYLPPNLRFDTDSAGEWSSAYDFPLNKWIFISIVRDSKFKYLYINGIEYNSISFENVPLTKLYSIFTIGYSQTSMENLANPIINGKINDFRIYDEALSSKEIYELSKAKLLHYSFDDFQEPTENIYLGPSSQSFYMKSAFNGVNYGFNSSTNMLYTTDNSDQPIDNCDVQKVYLIESNISQKHYVEFSDIILRGSSSTFAIGEKRAISFYYYGTFGTRIKLYIANSNFKISSENSLAGSDAQNIWFDVNEFEWNKISFIVENINTEASTFTWGWMILHSTFADASLDNNHYWKFTGIQVELNKDHSTEYVKAIRTGEIKDISGYTNNSSLELTSAPKWSSNSKVGKGSYDFNNKCIGINSPIAFKSTDEWSFSIWLKIPSSLSSDATWRNFITNALNENTNGTWLLYSGNRIVFYQDYYNSTSYIIYSDLYLGNQLPYDEWFQLAVTNTPNTTYNSTITMYIDGILKHAHNFNWSPRNAIPTIEFGKIGCNSGSRYFIGNIDDFRIYATTLSEKEVYNLYSSKLSLDNKGNLFLSELNEANAINTLSGTEITFKDSVDGVMKAVVSGNTVQACNYYSKTGLSSQINYTGKNLLDFTSLECLSPSYSCVYESNGIVVSELVNQYYAEFPNKIPVIPNTSYTLSFNRNTIVPSGVSIMESVLFRDESKAYIGETSSVANLIDGDKSITFTTSNDCHFINIRLSRVSSLDEALSSYRYTNIQLELGSSVTSYEPYVGGVPSPNPDYPQEIISNLPAGTYYVIDDLGDKYEFVLSDDLRGIDSAVDMLNFDKIGHTGSVVKKCGKVVLNGSLLVQKNDGISYNSNYLYYVSYSSLGNVVKPYTHYILATHLLYNANPTVSIGISVSPSGSIYINFGATIMTTNDSAYLMSWLAANPVTVIYQLATPTTNKITFTKNNSTTGMYLPLTYLTNVPSLSTPAGVYDSSGNAKSSLKGEVPIDNPNFVRNSNAYLNGIQYNSNIPRFDDGLIIEKATTNLSDGTVLAARDIAVTYTGIENGYRKYALSGTWVSGTYPYSMRIKGCDMIAGNSYSASVHIYTNVPEKFSSEFGKITITNTLTSTGPISTKVGDFATYSNFTPTVNKLDNPVYVRSQPISDGTVFDPETDFIYVKEPMLEQSPYVSSYIDYNTNRLQEMLTIPYTTLDYREGTIIFDFVPLNQPISDMITQFKQPKILQINDYYKNNSVTLVRNPYNGTLDQIFLGLRGDNATGWTYQHSVTYAFPSLNNKCKIALRWKNANTFDLVIDGNNIITNAVSSLDFTQMGNIIYGLISASGDVSGKYSNIHISKKWKSNQEIINSDVLDEYTTYFASLKSDLSSTKYGDVKSSSSNVPILKKIGNVSDLYNLNTGVLIKKISDWITLDGSFDWVDNYTQTIGFERVFIAQSSLGNMIANSISQTVVKYDSTLLAPKLPSDTSFGDCNGTGASGMNIGVHNEDSGWSDNINPTSNEIKAYFYGWRMCNADGTSPYYKSEVPYTPSTWAEWMVIGTGIVKDSTGLSFTADGTNDNDIRMTTAMKQNTKYGILYNVISSTLDGNMVTAYGTSPLGSAILPKTVGNQKYVKLANTSFTNNIFSFYVNNTNTSGTSIKIKDIRIFELPTGSQIETDFNNLTADQLAAKYTFNGLCVKNWQKLAGNDKTLVSVCPTISYDGYVPYKMIYQLETSIYSNLTPNELESYQPETKVSVISDNVAAPTIECSVDTAKTFKTNKNGIAELSSFSEIGITRNLITWYPLDGNANDYSGNNNHGTVNGAIIINGLYQNAYKFNGTSDYIDCGNGSILNLGLKNFSISAWFKTTSTSTQVIVDKRVSEYNGISIWMSGGNTLHVRGGNSSNEILSPTLVLNDDNWHYVSVSVDKKSQRILCVDGIFYISDYDSSDINFDSPNNLKIGVPALYNNYYFSGLIQDVRIYDDNLTKEEMLINYDTTKPALVGMKITKEDTYISGEIKEL